MLTPLQHNNNVTVHYLRNDNEEITVAKEHNPILYGKTLKRAPLWETAFSGVRIDIRGKKRDSIRLFRPYNYFNIKVTTMQAFYSLSLHFYSISLAAYFSAMLTASSPNSSVMNCREQASSSRLFAARHA